MPATRRAIPESASRRTIQVILPRAEVPVAPAEPVQPTRHTRREYARRKTAVAVIEGKLAEGATLRQAAHAARLTYSTGRRWWLSYRIGGEPGLWPGFQRSGRRSAASQIKLAREDIAAAQLCVLQARSVPAGLRQFARRAQCPPLLARLVIAGRVPPSIARAVRVQRVPAMLRIGCDWASLEFKPHVVGHSAKETLR